MESLADQFDSVRALAPKTRGRKFERFLGSVLDRDGIRHRLAFRPTGEEVDGALWWFHRTILLEAKWWKDPVPASAIYAFKGKVDGKFDNTLGLFISMSGYSSDCVDALSHGKNLNILLFDESDVIALVGGEPFSRMLEEKLFAAGQTGNVYMPWSDLKEAQKVATTVRSGTDTADVSSIATGPTPLIVVCEGNSDKIVLESLIQHVAGKKGLIAKVEFLVASGKHSLFDNIAPSLVSIMSKSIPGPVRILIVFDAGPVDVLQAESQRQRMKDSFVDLPPSWKIHIGVAIPEIEAWINADKHLSINEIETVLRTFSWDDAITKNDDLSDVYDFLVKVL